jgi:hypothetical protein
VTDFKKLKVWQKAHIPHLAPRKTKGVRQRR